MQTGHGDSLFKKSLEAMHATFNFKVQTKLGQHVDQKLLLLNINTLDLSWLPVTVTVTVTASIGAERLEPWNIVREKNWSAILIPQYINTNSSGMLLELIFTKLSGLSCFNPAWSIHICSIVNFIISCTLISALYHGLIYITLWKNTPYTCSARLAFACWPTHAQYPYVSL